MNHFPGHHRPRPQNRHRPRQRHRRFVSLIANAFNCVFSIEVHRAGMSDSCDIPYTKFRTHNGEQSPEFRLIAAVQKPAGLSIYFEGVPGNIADVNTIGNT